MDTPKFVVGSIRGPGVASTSGQLDTSRCPSALPGQLHVGRLEYVVDGLRWEKK